jgi:nitric oxide reductase activation protein
VGDRCRAGTVRCKWILARLSIGTTTRSREENARRDDTEGVAQPVDREGHEYLRQMCDDIGYEILGDIDSLPSCLPTLYRRLTE